MDAILLVVMARSGSLDNLDTAQNLLLELLVL